MELKRVWAGTHEPSGLRYEVVHWGEGSRINDGHGTWNFYVYIREDQTDRFPEIWLEDQIKEWSEGSGRKYLTHEYMDCPLAGADWHCGITFYEKGNHELPGQRYVKVGCDYSHYWDMGKHDFYNERYVQGEAEGCCASLAEILNIKPEPK